MSESTARVTADNLTSFLSGGSLEERQRLFRTARQICTAECGSGVLLRGIVEISSYCRNSCRYCGLRRQNRRLRRYRLSRGQILAAVARLARLGLRTVVLQAGEDPQLDPDRTAELIEAIKERWDIAVTLSLGEWPASCYRRWRDAGADRYLLKIETTDAALYRALHPGMDISARLRCLAVLRDLGYQTGSGLIIGLPGQSPASLAGDIRFLYEVDVAMIGIGPYVPHPQTPLSSQPPGSVEQTCTVIALTRCLNRNAHIPATSALAAEEDRRHCALRAGANVIMPNFTPPASARLYDIYPHAGRRSPEAAGPLERAAAAVRRAGRELDYSRGDSLKTGAEEAAAADTAPRKGGKP